MGNDKPTAKAIRDARARAKKKSAIAKAAGQPLHLTPLEAQACEGWLEGGYFYVPPDPGRPFTPEEMDRAMDQPHAGHGLEADLERLAAVEVNLDGDRDQPETALDLEDNARRSVGMMAPGEDGQVKDWSKAKPDEILEDLRGIVERNIQEEMEAARNGPETDPEAFRREREGSGSVDHPAFKSQAHALPTPDDFGRWLQAFLNKAAPYADGADIQGAVKMGTDEILAAYDRAKPGGNFSAKATVRRNPDGSATVLDVEVTPLPDPDPEPASPPDSVQRWVICVKKGETVYAVCSNRRGVLMPFRLHAIPPNYWVYSTKDIHEAAKVARWVRKLTPGTVETLPSLVLAKLMEMETAQAEDRMVAELPVPRVEGCKRCGKPLAYPGAVYCGAACTAQAEAGE